jgi:Tol biopolymer transport system component
LLGAPDGIHWASADGRQRGLFLPLGTSYVLIPGSIAPQGGHLAYSALDRRTGSSIWTVSVQPGDAGPVAGRPVAFFHSGAFDVEPRFSEDGRRLAYASLEAGSWKLRVRRFA